MLAIQTRGDGPVTVFFLHWLGGSGASWDGVVHLLQARFRCVQIDLPGFGSSSAIPGYTVEQMAGQVADVIRADAPASWVIAGHSMGAKVATVVARWSEDGQAGLFGLKSLVLAAGSPPSPEPMDESRREEMKKWFRGDLELRRKEAKQFVEKNAARNLDSETEVRAVADLLQMNRAAWVAWLDGGSKEDWSKRIGVLRVPAIIIAGEKDADLNAGAQHRLVAPHFVQAQVKVLLKAKHLLPMECSQEIAAFVSNAAELTRPASLSAAPIAPAYLALIESNRVSAATRETLLKRSAPDDCGYLPQTLSLEELSALRAVAGRVIPQSGIDLAARLDRQLTNRQGDGWRHATLPPDAEAYRGGLHTLDAEAFGEYEIPFAALNGAEQDKILERAASGKLGDGLLHRAASALGMDGGSEKKHILDAAQMKLWFEDVRGDLAKLYVSHPATLGRLGFSGIADEGGFVQLGVANTEAWEPR